MSRIQITVTDATGEIRELTEQEVYEIRSALGTAVDQGQYSDYESFVNLLTFLSDPYLDCEYETEKHWTPRSKKEI